MTRKHKRQKTTKPDLGLKKTDLKCFTFSSTKQGFFADGRTLLAKQKFNRRTTVSNDLVRKQPSKQNGPDPMEPRKFPNPLRKVPFKIEEDLGRKVAGLELGACKDFSLPLMICVTQYQFM